MMRTAILMLSVVPALLAQPQSRPAELAGENLPAYPIGSNDLVSVSVYDAPEFTRTIRVGEDGFIRLPLLKGRIQARGLMPSQLEQAIAEALRTADLIVDPYVTVTVAEYHSRPVSVMGAVRRPVTFQAAGPVTLLEALARAEGLTQDAGSEIILSREATVDGQHTTLLKRIPLKGLIDGADPELNVKLSGGEEIRVPEAGKIFVVGNVKKPGSFVIRDYSGMTVMKAVAVAEGLAPFAGKEAYVYRREESGTKNEMTIDLKKLMDRKSPDVPLMAGDVLYVPDAKGARMKFEAIEKVLLYGSAASSALIYAGVK